MYSTYFRDALLNWYTQSAAFPTAPATLYFSAHTADPTRTGTVAEVTTTIRPAGRPALAATNWDAIATVAGARETKTTAIIDFGNSAGAVSGDVTHAAIWDAASGGNCLEIQQLPAPIPVGLGTLVQVPIGLFKLNLP